MVGEVGERTGKTLMWVFIQVKVWLKRNLGQLEGVVTGRGRVLMEEQVMEGQGHPIYFSCSHDSAPKRHQGITQEKEYKRLTFSYQCTDIMLGN